MIVTSSSAPNPRPRRARFRSRRALFTLVLLTMLLPSFAGRTVAGPRPPTLARLSEVERAGAGLLNPPPSAQPAASADDAAYDIYLPAVMRGGSQETPGGGGGEPFRYSTFLLPFRLNSQIQMSKVPQVAVDPRGGVHVVYSPDYPDNSARRPAYYAYCPARCEARSNFSVTPLFEHVSFSQLALDSQGRPRMLIATWLPESGFESILHWSYAECDTRCTEPDSWAAVELGSGYWNSSEVESRQMFALDAQGRPRLVLYTGRAHPLVDPAVDMRFMYCDSRCTDAAQWGTTILSEVAWFDTALALTPGGLPRIAYTSLGDHQLNYLECSTPTCTEGTLNAILTTSDTSNYGAPTFSLRLDPQGRPRMAYYPGLTDASLPGGRLYYLACDVDCTSAGTWRGADIGTPTQNSGGGTILAGAGGVALALDAQGRPRLAFRIGMGMNELGYAWCNAGCEAGAGGWSHTVIASSDAQQAEIGVPPAEGCPNCSPPIPPCPGGFWDAGFWPSLALDPAGNPLIAYEVQLQRGGGKCDNATWARMSRLAVFRQP